MNNLLTAKALRERERGEGERAGSVEEVLREKRLAGTERGSRVLQCAFNRRGDRVRAAEHSPRDAFRLCERLHGLLDIVDGSRR